MLLPILYLVVSSVESVHVKDFSHTTLAMIDVFFIPVLLYGLKALDMKAALIKQLILCTMVCSSKTSTLHVTDSKSIRIC